MYSENSITDTDELYLLSSTCNSKLIFPVPCPQHFDWDGYDKTCYTTELHGPSNITTAMQTCEQLYPGAKLPELRNNIQKQGLSIRT